ncbi:PREDICTED: receptor-type guanylate cyclase Gyc76C-like isoform X2 [Nicrophorus vespilloides]|uniref:Guanylate cyclase n=1 Tax=Nicrophorus vespilloides TaxID=110193 RepID=A0ABM1MCH2_NICVS|nr:PREDICTED: receptor-type guanylate cyclase Gyc76C-like isoform X2 [Nicrophorus vespilloides]
MRLGPALLVALLPLFTWTAAVAAATTTTTAVVFDDLFGGGGWRSVAGRRDVDATYHSSPMEERELPSDDLRLGTVANENNVEDDDDDDEWKRRRTRTTAAVAKNKKKSLTVGYLTAVKGELKERQGLAVSGAITMALDEINKDESMLPNVTLVLRWNDTRGDTVVATRAMTDMICDGVVAFFGPEGTCHVEAIVAQARNIPMISYKCSDYKASDVPTFARTEPPDTQVTKYVISLMKYYDWKKFTIIYEEAWKTVALSLVDQAKLRNMTINDFKNAEDRHKCCEETLPCCLSGYWYQFIQETKNRTRIYVFLGTPMSLIELMNTMQTAQLFDKGEYMVISVDVNTYSDKMAHKYLWKPEVFDKFNTCLDHQKDFEKRGKSLFVIVPTAPTENYENFTASVRHYNELEPFNFTKPDIFLNYQKFVSIYAAYLYDSVKLYATALHALLLREPHLTEEIIAEIAGNGTRIVETIISLGTYKSITGATMRLDKNGDSEGNFSVLALTRHPSNTVIKNFTCAYQMRPVGQFQQGEFPDYQINPNVKIEWPQDSRPNDEPSCGFNNEMCKKNDTHLNSIIAAGILAILLFCAGVITMSIYRKWKIEQEIEGLLWKIDRTDIHGYLEDINSPTRASLLSVSVASYESRGGAQVFATTAEYKGLVVRIKELNFSRKKDISREVMKEMRLLRDLRHDNINSFIGACVEPMSIFLVTDYCAKGSLYDIIENEDIKLDRMFVASLVHDLIKGMMYIHNSMLVCHGNLKSSNCVVTSRWVLQVTDFGLAEMRHCAESDSIGEHQHFRNLFWKAPEMLRHPSQYIRGTQKGDVYAFGVILYEIIGRKGPFGLCEYEPKDIIEQVKSVPQDGECPFRPDLEVLVDSEIGCDDYVMQSMRDCWAEKPEDRPDFGEVRTRLKKMKDGKNRNIMDQMMEMMVTYADHLEELVSERTQLLHEEKLKTEDLLHRMLPKPVAERLTMGYGVEPEWFDLVTIYFSDIVGFTAMSAESTPLQVVNFLNDLYTVFDRIIKGYDVYKVETIGDAYMVVSGLPIRNGDNHAGEIASMSLDLLSAVKNHSIAHRPKETLKLRIGIHTGPVVAGVVGLTMPRYCLFGDTVNTASRMESNGEPLKIHISPQCKEALDKLGGYVVEERGLVAMKGKGQVRTYWLTGANESAIQRREVDLGELPPLFCRPRRSPKLNTDSRQASFCGNLCNFNGLNSRRHSSVPRDTYCCDREEHCLEGTSTEVESTSTLHNSSPIAGRLRYSRNVLHVPEMAASRQTLDSTTAFGSQNITEAIGGLRSRRVLSSIASSSDEHQRTSSGGSQMVLNGGRAMRESRSLDPLPMGGRRQQQQLQLQQAVQTVFDTPTHAMGGDYDDGRRNRRRPQSLENCCHLDAGVHLQNIRIMAIPDDRMPGHQQQQQPPTNNNNNNNNNFPNGDVINATSAAICEDYGTTGSGSSCSLMEDAEMPLLRSGGGKTAKVVGTVLRRRVGSVEETMEDEDYDDGSVEVDEHARKQWRSLETVPTVGDNQTMMHDGGATKNSIIPAPLKTLFNFFNGNGLKTSNTSLRKGGSVGGGGGGRVGGGVGGNALQAEKESIV